MESERADVFQTYAAASVAEKGELDVRIEVETLGGHSSVPRMFTSTLFQVSHA